MVLERDFKQRFLQMYQPPRLRAAPSQAGEVVLAPD